jgi:hypothetical protein
VSHRVLLRIGILLLLVAGSYLVGAFTVLGRLPGLDAVTEVFNALRAARHNGTRPTAPTVLSTSLIDLRQDGRAVFGAQKDLNVPGLEGGGGALTSFGADVLVLPFSGLIHAVTGADAIRPTGITGPETHRAALAAVADSLEAQGFMTAPAHVRYTGLTFVTEGSSRGLLAVYVEYHAELRCFTNTLARLPIALGVRSIDEVKAGPTDWVVIHRTKPCLPLRARKASNPGNGSGGRVVVVPPATAFWTSGDFSFDGMHTKGEVMAQDPAAEYGKVLATDLVTGATRVVSLGHRNPQGLVVRADGTILITEHGPHGGDELNTIQDGANYGWPLASYGRMYSGLSLRNAAPRGRHEHFALPTFAWVPSVGISSPAVIEGFHPAWDGDLLVASLKGKSLYRLRLEGGRVMYAEPILIGDRIRDVHQHGDGRLVLWTDAGQLIFLTPAVDQGDQIFLRRFLEELPAYLRTPTAQAITACSGCHDLTTGESGAAPSLARVYGGKWTREALLLYLENPERFAAGTKMPHPSIQNVRVREAIVSLLDRLDRAW